MSIDGTVRPRVELSRRPIWRLRLVHEAPRLLLAVLSLAGILASARFAIDPPRMAPRTPPGPSTRAPDLAAESYAVRFVRSYLTWRASEPARTEQEIEPYTGPGLEQSAGLMLPPQGEDQVHWAEVVQAREPLLGEHVYTVAAQTSAGLRYMTISVERTADGALALSGYPAFVGSPSAVHAVVPSHPQPVEDPELETVVRRALANYLSGSRTELDADLTQGANVALPVAPLRLITTLRQQRAPGGGAVLAVVQATDATAARYTLAYELDVTRSRGRWEISAIQTDPDE